MNDRELARPEEEEFLLPRGSSSANGKSPTSKTDSSKQFPKGAPPAKAGLCKLPWFGSWPTTLLVWVVGSNTLIFWSLPSPTFGGKLSVVRKLWSVNRIYKEDEDLKEKLKKDEEEVAELKKGVSGIDDLKSKVASEETETSRLKAQVKDLQNQLDVQRTETRTQRNMASEERKKKEQAEGELKQLRTRMSDSTKVTSELTSAKEAVERDRDREHQRAQRLAAKLKQLRDAETASFKDIDADLSR